MAADFTVSQPAFSTDSGFNDIDFIVSWHNSPSSLNALTRNLPLVSHCLKVM